MANTKGEAARTAAPARRTEAAGDRHRKDEATGTGEAVRTGAGDVTAILLLRGRGEYAPARLPLVPIVSVRTTGGGDRSRAGERDGQARGDRIGLRSSTRARAGEALIGPTHLLDDIGVIGASARVTVDVAVLDDTTGEVTPARTMDATTGTFWPAAARIGLLGLSTAILGLCLNGLSDLSDPCGEYARGCGPRLSMARRGVYTCW